MTATFPDISLSTERLVLRPYEAEDIPELVEMMNDELVTAWTGVPYPYTAADAADFVHRYAPAERAHGRGLVLAVTEMLTQRLVGTVTLQHTDWRIRGTEAGYLTAAWARGEGYACESTLALCRWLFREQGFERVELRTAADNTASQQVAQKIGCVSEGVLRGAGIVRTRPEGADPAAPWTETRTDLLVWSLLPEDLEEGGGTAGAGSERSYADDYTAFADWR
ncbi:GNAT family N-acetyltransferase [Actinacidiphila guanduensis]|uniref:Protein N-acetyltransferase, RimJ/RimL family n=1 Tax=Actinacidiphila guanduensis TaxID=310781 RepID=A0A1H0L2K0_9ACTN|nr:GNAT family N-acetyltransferase [Actinacidiphila guanduensis]SDO62305.1 Protein N-acetyltransferase, RimJ/RimL family [Actinacidiphila guanduensis]